MIRTHDEIRADRPPMTIVPLNHDAPPSATICPETAQDGPGVPELGMAETSGPTALSDGKRKHLPHCDGYFGGRCEPNCPMRHQITEEQP
jgi:hypothetical protein